MTSSITIRPDKVAIKLNLENFVVGSSLFIPCLNTHRAQVQLGKAMRETDMKITARAALSDGLSGIRVWRTK